RFAAGAGDTTLADQIVAVSLRHTVLSRFTAFVAVDRTRSVDAGGPPLPVTQPVELPRGWVAQSMPARPRPLAAFGGPGLPRPPPPRPAIPLADHLAPPAPPAPPAQAAPPAQPPAPAPALADARVPQASQYLSGKHAARSRKQSAQTVSPGSLVSEES